MEKKSEIIIYRTEDGKTKIDVRLENETVWLTQKQMAELFQKDRSTITEHINNIYEEGELTKDSTSGNFPQVRFEGNRKVKRNVELYNLDVNVFFHPSTFDIRYSSFSFLLHRFKHHV